MKRARIIYNPSSGRELFKRKLPEVLVKLERAGYETSCHETTGKGDGEAEAELASNRGFDIVIAAGGDGTINEVINGLAHASVRPKLGIIPAGTTNDFARALHIPRTIDKAVNVIVEGDTIPVDIGKMNSRYFINIAGGGHLTELSYEVPSKLKTGLGQLAYYLKGIEMIPKLKATEVSISYDGKFFEGEIMLFLIANTNSVGGIEKLAPDSNVQDGKFSLIILKKTNLADLIKIATLAVRGEHINDPNIIYDKASEISVTAKERMQINLDGEYGGDAPANFINLQRHIEIFVPNSLVN
ncbi:diacylglycerol kinase [Shimazuella sp. AN120528]|uniref:diacylglycerol kinase n=1 Tax=Shimazuella soli TaxID=1892854 RepID=UPI001F11854B|nr:diacylglycerol kinase [Shimazuella soli]MCH5586017.1 diacylglycerol kinase [Shimazuella soli]